MPDTAEFDELVEKFQNQAKQTIREFEAFVYKNFDAFDLDGDGFLTKDELEAAIISAERTVKEVGFLNFLLVKIREIAESYTEEGEEKPDAISKMDLEVYFSKL